MPYRQVPRSLARLRAQVQPRGALGHCLAATLETLRACLLQHHLNIGEAYVLGDSPLVLLTALQSSFEPGPSSSEYVRRPPPRLTAQGTCRFGSAGRPSRVCQRLEPACCSPTSWPSWRCRISRP